MIDRFGVLIPELSDLPARPRGIVLHWTGGTPRANRVDRERYHLIVNRDETVTPGDHPIAANMRRLSSGVAYAAHTGGFNSFRVGIAAAGMMGYRGPHDVGPWPLEREQVLVMTDLAGLCCDLWELEPSSPEHLCTHREVWTIHRVRGTRNHQKRDIEFLPFLPELDPDEVGPYLRQLAARAPSVGPPVPEWPQPEVVPPPERPFPSLPEQIIPVPPRRPWWRRLLGRDR